MTQGKGSTAAEDRIIKHDLGDKTIADICEALIGAAFLEYNKPGAFDPRDWDSAVLTVTKFVSNEDHTMKNYAEYFENYGLPTYQLAIPLTDVLVLAAKVLAEVGYKFRYPNLCRSAFTHPSTPRSHSRYGGGYIPNYQRLEFLGDSLLDMVCVTHLFYQYPDKDPQWLTEHKMAMVSNRFLGMLCIKLGFHRHLRHNQPHMGTAIRDFVLEIEEAERDSAGAKDFWTTVRNAPKCLADIVEAYVGAIFIDSDFDYSVVQSFFDNNVAHFFEDMSIYDTFANNHPITRLHSLLNVQMGCNDIRVMCSPEVASYPGQETKIIAGVMIHNEVAANGRASTNKAAKARASAAAIKLIEGLAPHEYRAKYGCDCRPEAEPAKESITTNVD